jgi:hypothetical protein
VKFRAWERKKVADEWKWKRTAGKIVPCFDVGQEDCEGYGEEEYNEGIRQICWHHSAEVHLAELVCVAVPYFEVEEVGLKSGERPGRSKF